MARALHSRTRHKRHMLLRPTRYELSRLTPKNLRTRRMIFASSILILLASLTAGLIYLGSSGPSPSAVGQNLVTTTIGHKSTSSVPGISISSTPTSTTDSQGGIALDTLPQVTSTTVAPLAPSTTSKPVYNPPTTQPNVTTTTQPTPPSTTTTQPNISQLDQSIANLASSFDQYHSAFVEANPGSGCNPFSAYFHRGDPTVPCPNGWEANYWCADFAEWVWVNSGISDVSGITDQAISFIYWGQSHPGSLHLGATNDPQVGDAVVWGNYSSGYGSHVGLVVGVQNGQIEVVSGNAGPAVYNGAVARVWNSGYIDPTTSTADGDPIIGYVTPS
ncbi:MAG: CHAP domain-containing protein [Acidimicrobiales bacterium]|nr:CHAP domain-containing protein [Acidimicrobiales bacterium]